MRNVWRAMVAKGRQTGIPTVADALLHETWMLAEFGEGGRRAFYYSIARKRRFQPRDERFVCSHEGPSQQAYGWVAETLCLSGEAPAEAVRQSVARFRRGIKDEIVFGLDGRTMDLTLVSGRDILRAWGLHPN